MNLSDAQRHSEELTVIAAKQNTIFEKLVQNGEFSLNNITRSKRVELHANAMQHLEYAIRAEILARLIELGPEERAEFLETAVYERLKQLQREL